MANQPRQEIGGSIVAGRERILANNERIKGDAGRFQRDLSETLGETLRKKQAGTEGEVTIYVVDIEQFEWVKEVTRVGILGAGAGRKNCSEADRPGACPPPETQLWRVSQCHDLNGQLPSLWFLSYF